MTGFPILSLVLWLPALGGVLLLLLPRDNVGLHRTVALAFALLAFGLSLVLPLQFDPNATGAQFFEQAPWIPAWGISYSIGLDGISLWLVVLTTFLTPIALLSTWGSITSQVRYFQVLMLLLETAMMGVFVALDTFLFYLFWEFTLIPMAFMIGIWGSGNRLYAARKFFLYTFAGSVLMLLGIIGLSFLHRDAVGAEIPTFNLLTIVDDIRNGAFVLDTAMERILFGLFFAAFAIKVPLWPFHTWLPDAHVQAPTAGSVILAGVLLKLGTYGLIRFNLTLFPDASAWAAPAIGILAVIGIIYGAWIAFAQTDMKKLVAYSSVSHMGFVVLGIFALNEVGISGAVLQMINHGLSTGALFLAVGYLYERRHTREMAQFGGLWKNMPVYGSLTLVMVLSSVGLPGLNGFIGEYAIMQGAFTSPVLGWGFVAWAVIGVILAATYLLRMFRETFMGELDRPENEQLSDLTPTEVGMMVALLIPIVAIGIVPSVFFAPMQSSVAEVVQTLSAIVAGSQ
ncbi:MAG: NADH-quinone oxidoreductase subunit M [Chloroflexaceae bacterium]|nr:NADH-quinone oxidoreductase subunit M [Chloroflexaceae bacterium]NJL33597.1 NADH-quinone oxidoreductase subunit M [Chloroflexaceae bacterium]NJO06916.1 NADH-quinone oxidoreductase subunit M [Chloroflexaceae bacterium]